MKKRLRVGVIGCGQISKLLHVPDYASCAEATLVALCDTSLKAAKGLAARWAPDAALYGDYKEMLKKEDLDAVTVTLPNRLHGSVTIAALKAGCHVLVEKPMALSSAEAQRMLDTAKKHKRLLMVNQCQRLMPVHARAREVVRKGFIGKILHLTAMFGHGGPEHWSPKGKWFFKKDEARFGAMADLGVHKADLIRYITGKEVARVSAYMGCLEKKGSDVDDNFVSCLTFTDGTVGTLASSWTVKGMDANYMILHGTKGSLRIMELPDKPLVANLVDPDREVVFDIPASEIRYEGSWGMDVSGAFCRAVLGQEAPFCSGEEGKKALEIILAAEKSALTGRSVELKH